jgi:predicted DNA-binding transcriptional regulator YafY
MILQSRGRVTARHLALELEVSERTIYRDIIALSIAGVPVCTESGPGGGISLLESYRTTLTGLNQDEIQALFMVSIPSPLAQLGVSKELKAALHKVSAALPHAGAGTRDRVRQRVLLDWDGWFVTHPQLPHLKIVHQAIWADKKIFIQYSLSFGAQAERVVDPLGLVAKANNWYLVYLWDRAIRVLRFDQLIDAKILDQVIDRPADFDLEVFWREWCREYEANRPQCMIKLRFAPSIIPYLPHIYGYQIKHQIQEARQDQDGWFEMSLEFENFEQARMQVLGLGGAVEVVSPTALRMSVCDFARQILSVYPDDLAEKP